VDLIAATTCRRAGRRFLNGREKSLLIPVFGFTLPYEEIWLGRNDMLWGGPDCSITPGTIPIFAVNVWKSDFSIATYTEKWIFVHEMTHVWQSYHGNNNVWCAVKLWWKYSDYAGAYDYNLDDNEGLRDYNMEQQASIVADYWFVTENKTPKNNRGMRSTFRAYEPLIAQLQASGPPRDPKGARKSAPDLQN
jgi:hypothetical protein